MKSRPMIFSAPMVRAILAGQKTQTRRIYKPKHCKSCGNVGEIHRLLKSGETSIRPCPKCHGEVKCPYGVIGDRIWVRESWCEGFESRPFWYKADFVPRYGAWEQDINDDAFGTLRNEQGWKSSMFMPRAASRIELEITGVRVERLQDIGDSDAIAEGVEVCSFRGLSAEEEYSVLWTQIHGYDDQKGWNANPWVWVVEFKRVEVQS